jgi:hypothetical protein
MFAVPDRFDGDGATGQRSSAGGRAASPTTAIAEISRRVVDRRDLGRRCGRPPDGGSYHLVSR